METLDIGMDIAIYFAEVIRKQYPETIYWGYFTKPKNQMYVNQPVLLGFRADIPLCPAQIVKVCTWKSSEKTKKTRLYDVYQKRIQLIGYDHGSGNGNKNVCKSFEILFTDIRNTKTLSFCDNPKCRKEAFFPEQKADDKTRKENYKKIKSQEK